MSAVSTTGNARRIRVLIVDDSLFMRAAIAKTLAAGPFEVVGQAKDGKGALEMVAKLAPDVITMDFNMPGMNGAETVRGGKRLQACDAQTHHEHLGRPDGAGGRRDLRQDATEVRGAELDCVVARKSGLA